MLDDRCSFLLHESMMTRAFDQPESNETHDADGNYVWDDDALEFEDELELEDEYDGQPDEYTEWQDLNGGDDWDHGQYDDC